MKKYINKAQRACGAISAGVTTDCNNIPTAGIESTIWIANKADIASVTMDPANPTLATDITMVATKVFYKYIGLKKIGKPLVNNLKGVYANGFQHSIEFVILQNSPTAKLQLDLMNNGSLVAIVQNKTIGTTGNQKYELYGREAGLEVEALTKDGDDADTLGGYKIVLKTADGDKENHLPATIFATDLATTDALIASLD